MPVLSAFRRLSVWIIRLYSARPETHKGARRSSTLDEDIYLTDLAPDMDEYITIATFDKTTDAHIALGRLSAEGIHAQLFDDNMVQMDWLYSIALGGIKLRVSRADEILARHVLATDYSRDLDDVDVGEPET